jgi:uncharacterized protein
VNNDISPRLGVFYVWLAAFLACWLAMVAAQDLWQTVATHWPIALSMAFGSYIAGSTPMGGGTVGFPVLVLLFDLPGSLGRSFALAVQSIGMVSASIYLLSARRPLEWRLLRPAMVGAIIGTPIGAALIAPSVPDLWVKLTFAIVWCSFGVMHLVKLQELITTHPASDRFRPWDRGLGMGVGLCGGIVSSITGVGIDMLLYATLVLLYRADLKTAIPSSVVIMAFTSVIGISTNLALAWYAPSRFAIAPELFPNWLAAAPVVACGAPLGALVVNLISRAKTLVLVSLLCIAQFVWTLMHERVGGLALVGAIGGVLLMNGVFHLLYKWGRGESALEFEDSTGGLQGCSEVGRMPVVEPVQGEMGVILVENRPEDPNLV